jgi:hypothetical protein
MLVLRKFWWGTASEEVLFLYFCCSYLLTQETEKLHQWQKRTPASLRSLFSGWDKHDIAISTLYSRSHFCSYRWAVAFFQTTFVYPSSICSFQTELFVVDFWINLKISVQFTRAYSLASLIICPEQCLVVSQHIIQTVTAKTNMVTAVVCLPTVVLDTEFVRVDILQSDFLGLVLKENDCHKP